QNPGPIARPDTVSKIAGTAANSSVNVYVSGKENNKPIYWKNGSPVHLTTLSPPNQWTTGIAVSGNDVYVGGSSAARAFTNGGIHFRALYWKNDSIVFLSNGLQTTSIAVSGHDL